jgi:ABC-type transport system substrate-binding protein
MKRPPLDNVMVRQALRYAIDVNTIAKELYGGLADPVHSFLPPFMWSYSDDVMKFNYDPNKAKQMLKDAGVDLNSWQPSILGSSTSIYATKLDQAVSSYWSDIGVKAKNDLLEQGVFLQRRAAGDYDMFSIGPGRIEPDQIATAYFRTGSTVNNSFYSGADDLIDAARAEPDRTKRADLYKQLQQRIAIDSPCAFLVAPNSSLALNKRVAGIAGAGWLHRYDWFNVDVPAE